MNHARILVADDEPFIALDLELAIEDAGGEVVGSVARVGEALALLKAAPVDGAILDVNLLDGDISPVVEIMIARGIPFIIQTGVGLPADLASRIPDLAVRIKPCIAAELVGELALLISNKGSSRNRSKIARHTNGDGPEQNRFAG